MEETLIVMMLKDKTTGYLEKELGTYRILEGEKLINTIFATEEEDGIFVHMNITTDRDVSDWEYDAILDYYDETVFSDEADTVLEVEETFNPVWELVFRFHESHKLMEEKINALLLIHKNELSDVEETIKENMNEYNL